MGSEPVTQAPSRPGVGLALAALGAVAFSGKAIIIKLAYRHGTDPTTLIMLRMLFALPLFAAMAWWASRGKQALSLRDWAGVAYLGITGYYLSSYLDFLGLQYVTASLERLILYLNPTLVVAMGWFMTRKPLRRTQLLGMATSYGGVLLVFGHEVGLQGAEAAKGSALVLASAVMYALYMVYSGQMVKRVGALRLVGLATTVACLCVLVHFAATRPVAAALDTPMPVVWLSLLNATVCTAIPVLLVMMAIERVGPGVTAQTGMVGPLSTIFMGVALLGEPFTAWVAAGTVLVIAGIYLFTRAPRAPAPQSRG